MRKTLLLIFPAIALISVTVHAHDNCDCHCTHPVCAQHHAPYYIVIEDKVFYDGHEVKGASASSFEILKDGYAKDAWNVFYCGGKTDASVSSFTVLEHGYARDAWNVYFDGQKMAGASPDSFRVLRDGYAKDAWNVYYYGEKIG